MFNGVNVFNVKIVLLYEEYTFSLMVFDMNVSAMPEKVDNPPAYFLASSLHKTSKLEKGESKTKQPI